MTAKNRQFDVIVTRDTTESATIRVTAKNKEEAGDKALEFADSHEVDPKPDAKYVRSWEQDDGNYPDDAYLPDPDGGIEEVTDPEPLTCKKCGTPLNKKGYCKDKTCPYSNHLQDESFTEG